MTFKTERERLQWVENRKEQQRLCAHEWKYDRESYDGADDCYVCTKCGKESWIEYD